MNPAPFSLESESTPPRESLASATCYTSLIEVFKSGGGTQSTAIAALIIQGRLPKPDFVVIADTGMERETTWQYMDQVTAPALKKIGIEVHRPTREKYAYKHDDLWNGKGTILIPAFTDRTVGQIGKLDGYCSKWWKVEVAQNYLRREFGIKPAQCKNWIGFSIDETKRVFGMMVSDDYKAGRIRLPLVDDVPMKRQHSKDYVTQIMGWPDPPRSACWMCPNMPDAEWKSLTPEEHEKACQKDEAMRERDPNAFLHYSCRPLREVDFDANRDLPGLDDYACSSGVCFV